MDFHSTIRAHLVRALKTHRLTLEQARCLPLDDPRILCAFGQIAHESSITFTADAATAAFGRTIKTGYMGRAKRVYYDSLKKSSR